MDQSETEIHAQLVAILGSLKILVGETKSMSPDTDQFEHRKRSDEYISKISRIHTLLYSSTLDLTVWLDDVSGSTINLPDAFERLANYNAELDRKLRRMLRDMQNKLCDIPDLLSRSRIDPGITGPASIDDRVLDLCNAVQKLVDEFQSIKSDLQNELGSIGSEKAQQENSIINRPPSILCLDGGGVRSFLSLIILRQLMEAINSKRKELGSPQEASTISPLKPCDVFDFIFGSSSGGLLAIMLGRLEMSVEECFERFRAYSRGIFQHPKPFFHLRREKYSHKRLIQAVRHVVGDFDPSPESEKWRRTIFEDTSGRCKTGVLAYKAVVGQSGTGMPYMIRSYACQPKEEPQPELHRFPALNPGPASSFQIWEAARATTAAPTLFNPLKHKDQEFYDGGITSNNPTLQALGEVQTLLQGTPIKCVVSIGCGIKPIRMSSGSTALRLIDRVRRTRLLTNALTETRDIERLSFTIMHSKGTPYFRLNPELERNVAIDEWIEGNSFTSNSVDTQTLNHLERIAGEYLNKDEVNEELRKCAEILTFQNISPNDSRRAVLDWLDTIDYAPEQRSVIQQRLLDTGKWLLDSHQFRAWCEIKKQTLFCCGDPGVGKTILTSIVIKHLTTNFDHDESVGFAYIYCNYRRSHEKNTRHLLANLLKQLTEGWPGLPDGVKSLYEKHREYRSLPSREEISGALHSVTALYSRVFIIVDALDESSTAIDYRETFLSEIFNLQAKYGVNIFITSRNLPYIEDKFRDATTLMVRATVEDLSKYIDHYMPRLPGFIKRNQDLQNEIKTEVIEAADGIFLLAQLYLHSLTKKLTPRAIREALVNLPVGVAGFEHAYQGAMQRINSFPSDEKGLACRVLSWISCANRPLTALELQYALAVEIGAQRIEKENMPTIEDMVDVCAGLVTLDKESGIIRLVHYTTHEYFQQTHMKWFPDVQAYITSICGTYLSFDVFESGICQTDDELEERLRTNPFYDYAAHYWGHHARIASRGHEIINDFLRCGKKVEASSQTMMAQKFNFWYAGYSQQIPKQMTGLHVAAYFGVKEAVASLLEELPEPDIKDDYRRTALSYAAENGYEDTVKLLISKGAAIDSMDKFEQTPLSRAAKNGHLDVIRLLINDRIASLEDISGRIPLWKAALVGNEGVLELLLAHGAEINSTNTNFRQSPLSFAAYRGHERIVKILLENGAHVDLQDYESGRTPLSWAAEEGHDTIVQVLIDHDAAINLQDTESGRTPLLRAAMGGHMVVLNILIDNGAIIDLEDASGRTALWWAATRGHTDVVTLLLNHGAKTNVHDLDSGQTPLLRAIRKGNKEILRQLLCHDAEVDRAETVSGRTPLSWAAESGDKVVVQLLLENNASINLKDHVGQTPLWWAAKAGHDNIVKLFKSYL